MRTLNGFENDSGVIHLRYMQALLVIVGLTFLLVARVVYLQIAEHDRFESLSQENHIDEVSLKPVRGLIYDRHNEVLARNVRVFNLEVLPDRIRDMSALLNELSHAVELTPDEIGQFKTTLKSRPSFERQILKTNLDEEEAAIFSVNQHRFPGVELNVHLQRNYPHGNLTAHVVGHVGRISPQDRETVSQRGDYSGISHIGKIGIESHYESMLKGQPGRSQVEMNAHGRIIRHLSQTLPDTGRALHLSLDIKLQEESMKALEGYEGAVVAIEPKTGEVLAMASVPTFDPNLFVNGISRAKFSELNTSSRRPLFNRSIYGQYAPGSTIKGFMSLVGIENGYSHDRRVFCPGWFRLPNNSRRYRCWKKTGHGYVDGNSAIEQSCDVYYYNLAVRIGIDRIHEGMSRFGFGQKTGIDLPNERSGLMPSRDWKQRARQQSWFPGDTVNVGIGQGYMLMTPLQLASVTATLANRGKSVTPRLLRMTENSVSQQLEPHIVPDKEKIELKDGRSYDAVIEGMRRVVYGNRGTARRLQEEILYDMAGKTGTAQVVGIGQDETYDEESTPKEHRDHSLFVGFAPLQDPRIAIAVIVEHGGSGSQVAAPIARRLIDYYLIERLKMYARPETPSSGKEA
ncbi:MAG: penicillin-binding protein 2 [Gammaproteobacteria bacterium]|nr:penicillin-binding protein 2 [Gammaproteobacteria bacterium]